MEVPTPLNLYRTIPDRATLEREYSPSSCVDDIGVLLDEYTSRSERARATVPGLRSLAYGPAEAERIDFFPAARSGEVDGAGPLVVFVHGGYWQELSPTEHSFPAAGLAPRGIHYAAVGYGLAPAATLREMVERCCRAVDWLFTHADRLGVDPDRIHLAGSSAGAHLAAMVALSRSEAPPLASLTLLSGVFDLRPIPLTYVNDALGLTDEQALLSSPLLLVDTTAGAWPPTLVAVGENETGEFHRQSVEFADALTAKGVPVTSCRVAGRNHFDIVFDLADPDTVVGAELTRRLGLRRPHG